MAANAPRGLLFERSCVQSLKQFGFSLVRIGGTSDGGFDLVGPWQFPTEDISKRFVRVGVQCKSHESRNVGVRTVRELEGSLARFTGTTKCNKIGFICSHSGFSAAALSQCAQSEYPLGLVDFEDLNCVDITSFYINESIQKAIPGLVVTEQRFSAEKAVFNDGPILPKPLLLYDGHIVSNKGKEFIKLDLPSEQPV
uniref:Restriction endonuclease type IV Mrr domain-containing protein n=1 Tax=Mucochytrium quahogii TaxID=96639 RepID=A0A7S2RNE0_9STRA|mmetsp:Transcript_3420/g.4942  ORF Transcript_3420/g.4942 Transcript_3420/m.4942 type:complete len:197 (-) Transcript_3420:595-1185(-)